MAFNSAEDLTVKTVLNAIRDVTEWYDLGIQLNIRTGMLNKIKADNRNNTNGAKTEMIDYWLNNDSNASWVMLAAALKEIGHGNLSCRLMPQSCQDDKFSKSRKNTETNSKTVSPLSSAVMPLLPHSPPQLIISKEAESSTSSGHVVVCEDKDRPSSPLNISNTEELICDLEVQFGELVEGINEDLKNNVEKIDKLPGILKFKLPQRLKGMRHHITYTSVTVENFDKFFDDLHDLWNFIDYDLLKHMIMSYKNKTLISKLKIYEKKVEKFCAETTVKELIKYWQPRFRENDITNEFKTCVTELSLDPTTCKVEDIKMIQRKLKDTVPQELAMAAFCLFDIKQSTIKVIWLVWSEFVSQLEDIIRSILESSPNFIIENNILCLTLNKVILYSSYYDEFVEAIRSEDVMTVRQLLSAGHVDPNHIYSGYNISSQHFNKINNFQPTTVRINYIPSLVLTFTQLQLHNITCTTDSYNIMIIEL